MTNEERAFADAVTDASAAGLSAGELLAMVKDVDPGAQWDQLYDTTEPTWHLATPAPADHECRSMADLTASGEDRRRLLRGDTCCSAADHGGAGCACTHECHVGDPEHPFAGTQPF